MDKVTYLLTVLYIGLIPLEAITIEEGVSYGRIVFIMMFASSLFNVTRNYRLQLNQRPHLGLLLLFIFYCFISALWSIDVDRTLYVIAKMIQWFIITIVATNTLSTYKRLRMAMFAYCVGCLYIGFEGFALYQIYGELSTTGDMLEDFGNRNENAFMINYGIIFLLIINEYLDNKTKILSYVCYGMLLIFIFFILILGSRNGLIMSIAIGVGLFVVTMQDKSRIWALSVFALIIFGTFLFFNSLPDTIQDRYLGIENDIKAGDMSGRGWIWERTLDYIFGNENHNIILGIGWGTFADFFKRHFGVYIGAHNFYLNVFTTAGVVGFGIIIAYLYRLYTYIKKSIVKKKIVFYMLLIIPLISMMTTNWEGRKWWFVISVFIYQLYYLSKKNLLPQDDK